MSEDVKPKKTSTVECVICLDTIEDKDVRKDFLPCALQCGHIVCLTCSLDWKQKTCAYCRKPYTVLIPLIGLVANQEAIDLGKAYLTSVEADKTAEAVRMARKRSAESNSDPIPSIVRLPECEHFTEETFEAHMKKHIGLLEDETQLDNFAPSCLRSSESSRELVRAVLDTIRNSWTTRHGTAEPTKSKYAKLYEKMCVHACEVNYSIPTRDKMIRNLTSALPIAVAFKSLDDVLSVQKQISVISVLSQSLALVLTYINDLCGGHRYKNLDDLRNLPNSSFKKYALLLCSIIDCRRLMNSSFSQYDEDCAKLMLYVLVKKGGNLHATLTTTFASNTAATMNCIERAFFKLLKFFSPMVFTEPLDSECTNAVCAIYERMVRLKFDFKVLFDQGSPSALARDHQIYNQFKILRSKWPAIRDYD